MLSTFLPAAGGRAGSAAGPSSGCRTRPIHLLEGGHFLLESALDDVARLIRGFLGRFYLPPGRARREVRAS
ncbi:hypothetical protein E1267_09500 [Nonomuraea longispora]|uniref:Alpha/beta hydrolase n=1 Tax=Nonomuraea longispora TaxID=1848320 RepID=A0A4R4NM05_9ACTN|nr:hypothetical protein E1267_09500 [Nonomuraea longispora]